MKFVIFTDNYMVIDNNFIDGDIGENVYNIKNELTKCNESVTVITSSNTTENKI